MSARLYDSTEAADRLGISEHMVRVAYRSGLLPHRKVGRFVKFTDGDLDEYVERIRATTQPGGMQRSPAAAARKRRAS